MLRTFTLVFAKAAMVCMVAFSLLAAGFAHRPALSATDIQQVEYLASLGLTAADLCAIPGEDGPMAMDDCPVCHLAAGLTLPPPMGSVQAIELRVAAAVLIPAQTRGLGRVYDPAAPVRAPPSGLIAFF